MEIFMIEDTDILESMSRGDVEKLFQAFYQQTSLNVPTIAKNFIEEMTNNHPDILVLGAFTYFFKYYARFILNIPTLGVHLQAFVCTASRALKGFFHVSISFFLLVEIIILLS